MTKKTYLIFGIVNLLNAENIPTGEKDLIEQFDRLDDAFKNNSSL
jgi:hypothetical protein